MKVGKISLYFLCIVLFMVQPIIEDIIGPFKYYDEIVVVLLFLNFLRKFKIDKTEAALLAGLFVLICIGLIGNYRSLSGQPMNAIVQDVLSNAKLILLIVSVRRVRLSSSQQKKLSNYLSGFTRALFLVMFLTSIISVFFDIGMTAKARYGVGSYQFLFSNPAGLNTYCYLYMTVFSITLMKNGRIRKNSVLFMIMGVIPWVLTLRSRAIAFAALYVMLFVYLLFIRRGEYKLRFYHILFVGIGLVLLSWDSIDTYFISNDRVSRYQLLRKAFVLAKDYFPFGSGFGTFGTQASRDYYSQIYYRYGLSSIYGLNPSHPSFVTDQYWFGIIGQFGYAGLITMIYIIFKTYKEIWNLSKKEKEKQLAAFTLFYTSIIAGLTAGTFIQASILPSIMVFYLFRANRQ